MKKILMGCVYALLMVSWSGHAQRVAAGNPLSALIEQVQPSIVGVGVVSPSAQPVYQMAGTGFAVGDGHWIVTNAHVLPAALDTEKHEQLAVFLFSRTAADGALQVQTRIAEIKQLDREHDLALLRIEGAPLPALRLSTAPDFLLPGSELVFTGYALGQAFGPSLTTHRGMISAVTRSVLPIPHAQQLNAAAILALRKKPFTIYQLDATAFPGDSGSPIYASQSGEVVAVIFGGLVKGNREMAISTPSGITYAVPVQYVWEALQGAEK
ncbi:MAG: serine protease [Burkholderiaceae bacterium]|nr:MAG: serine protease [Burkholderiaceae bacterium]